MVRHRSTVQSYSPFAVLASSIYVLIMTSSASKHGLQSYQDNPSKRYKSEDKHTGILPRLKANVQLGDVSPNEVYRRAGKVKTGRTHTRRG